MVSVHVLPNFHAETLTEVLTVGVGAKHCQYEKRNGETKFGTLSTHL